MALIRRVRAVWTGVAGTPYYSNFYFNNLTGDASSQSAAVGNLFGDLVNFIRTGVSITVEDEVPLIDSVTGDIQSVDIGVNPTLVGADPTEALPPANQILVRQRTDTFITGRRLLGKFYLGGQTQTVNDAGAVGAPQRSVIAGAFNEMLQNPDVQWVVWSRTSGQVADVTDISISPQFAVLRSRRD